MPRLLRLSDVLSGALAGRSWLRERIDRNLKSPLERPYITPGVVHVVRKLDHLQAPAPRAQHLDGKDHERSHAHHIVRDQKSSPRIHPD